MYSEQTLGAIGRAAAGTFLDAPIEFNSSEAVGRKLVERLHARGFLIVADSPGPRPVCGFR